IHLRGVVIVHVAGDSRVGVTRNRGINCMLVRPCGVAAGGMDDTVDRVRPDEIPGIDWLAVVEGIARQTSGIDGLNSAVDQAIRPAAIECGLVEYDAFLIFSGSAIRDSQRTVAPSDSI